jgi:hypothetical protein
MSAFPSFQLNVGARSLKRFEPYAVLLVTLIFSGTAAATTIVAPSIEEMAVEADAIVVGVVEGVETTEHEGRFHRTVTIEVSDVWKGLCDQDTDCPTTIQVRALGGRGAERATRVHGAEQYAVGERVLVFLQRNEEAGPWRSHVLAWTKFELKDISGAVHAVREVDELTPVRAEADGAFRKVSQPDVQFELEAIRQRVQNMLSEGGVE